MNPMIEFCVSNLARGSQEALEILEKDPNLDVLEYGCLSYCGKCMESLFALVNGEVVTGGHLSAWCRTRRPFSVNRV